MPGRGRGASEGREEAPEAHVSAGPRGGPLTTTVAVHHLTLRNGQAEEAQTLHGLLVHSSFEGAEQGPMENRCAAQWRPL